MIIAAIAVLVAGYFAHGALQTAQQYDGTAKQYAAQWEPTEKSKLAVKAGLERITRFFGMSYAGHTRHRLHYQKLQSRLTALQQQSWLQLAGFLSSSLIAVLVLSLYRRGSVGLNRVRVWCVGIVAAMAIAVGVLAPAISITAFADISMFGKVLFEYDSKSIAGVITSLWQSNNPVVAIMIALFSITIPALKITVLGLVMLLPDSKTGYRAKKVLAEIGKWSMADVFVIAMSIAFFAADNDSQTDAHLMLGFWFFVAYVGLSMLMSILALRQSNSIADKTFAIKSA